MIYFDIIHYLKVINRRRKFFTQYKVPRAIELADALVGSQTALQPQHGVLKSGTFAFVILENQLYVARGMKIRISSLTQVVDALYSK